jgi:hypothetical protein
MECFRKGHCDRRIPDKRSGVFEAHNFAPVSLFHVVLSLFPAAGKGAAVLGQTRAASLKFLLARWLCYADFEAAAEGFGLPCFSLLPSWKVGADLWVDLEAMARLLNVDSPYHVQRLKARFSPRLLDPATGSLTDGKYAVNGKRAVILGSALACAADLPLLESLCQEEMIRSLRAMDPCLEIRTAIDALTAVLARQDKISLLHRSCLEPSLLPLISAVGKIFLRPALSELCASLVARRAELNTPEALSIFSSDAYLAQECDPLFTKFLEACCPPQELIVPGPARNLQTEERSNKLRTARLVTCHDALMSSFSHFFSPPRTALVSDAVRRSSPAELPCDALNSLGMGHLGARAARLHDAAFVAGAEVRTVCYLISAPDTRSFIAAIPRTCAELVLVAGASSVC